MSGSRDGGLRGGRTAAQRSIDAAMAAQRDRVASLRALRPVVRARV